MLRISIISEFVFVFWFVTLRRLNYSTDHHVILHRRGQSNRVGHRIYLIRKQCVSYSSKSSK